MEADYDVVVLGTGLKECLLSAMLTSTGRKVLQLDREKHYGGATSSVNPLDKFLGKFRPAAPPDVVAAFGRGEDWYVDLVSKFLMADGTLAKLLSATGASRYLYFKSVESSYYWFEGKLHKMPVDPREAFSSPLMGLFEKRRLRNFLYYVKHVDEGNAATWEDTDINTCTMQQLYDKYNLSKPTQDFTGHAIALHRDDAYLGESAAATVGRLKMYAASIARYGKSPYLYPLYGIADLAQSFARVARHGGGVFQLGKAAVETIALRRGRAVGVRVGGRTVGCRQVYCDPSYAPDRVRRTGTVVRCVCFLDHPVPDTNMAASAHIIIPYNQVGRRSDMYVTVVSSAHHVCPKGWHIATITATVETDDVAAELRPALALLGAVRHKCVAVDAVWEPLEDGVDSQVFVSTSYDATVNFETVIRDALDMFRRGTGREFDFS